MKHFIIGTIFFALGSLAEANVVFYVNAHGDDATLFMGRSLSNDIKASVETGHRVILITATAGDAGTATGNGDGVSPKYLARERGHSNVLQFLWGRTGVNNAQFSSGMVNVGKKNVHRSQIISLPNGGYVAWYNIRLPDGNIGGDGYASTGLQSLIKLENGKIRTISSIDQSSSYTKN